MPSDTAIGKMSVCMKLLCKSSLILLVFLAAGCTREIDPALQAPTVLGEPLPLTVGVYYDDDLRNHRVKNRPSTIDFVISTGRAHVSFFDDLFSKIFVRTVPMKRRFQLPEDGERLDAVIEPEIVSLTYRFIDDGGFDMKVPVEIRYAITLYSSIGEQLSLWSIAGEGFSQGYSVKALHEGIEIAMRDAAARFVVALYKDTDMQSCLESLTAITQAAGQLETCLRRQ